MILNYFQFVTGKMFFFLWNPLAIRLRNAFYFQFWDNFKSDNIIIFYSLILTVTFDRLYILKLSKIMLF